MFTRRIFIIGSPLNEDVIFQSGVKSDVINYKRYFQSAIGGAFDPEHEITILKNPSWERLKANLMSSSADFTIFIFSGHGFFATNTGKIVFNISEKDAVAVQTIADHIQSPRKLIISDACQSYMEGYHYLEGIGDTSQYMNFHSSISKTQARQLFNRAVVASPRGTQLLMSCSRGQESVLSETGSFFSYALLSSSQVWANAYSQENVLTVLKAGKITASYIKNNYSPDYTAQRPSCLVTKLKPNFPIGVKYPSSQLLY